MFIREKTSVVLVRLALGVIAGTSLLTQVVHAQEASMGSQAAPAKIAGEAEITPVQKVYVTGSNVRRIALETASPVQIITREELTRGGATSLNEVLRTISSNVGGVDENRVGRRPGRHPDVPDRTAGIDRLQP